MSIRNIFFSPNFHLFRPDCSFFLNIFQPTCKCHDVVQKKRRKKVIKSTFMRMQKMEDEKRDRLPRTFVCYVFYRPDESWVRYVPLYSVHIPVQCDTYKYNRLLRHQLLVQIWRESRNWEVRTPFSSYYTLMVSPTSLQLSLFFINCRNTV